MTWVTLTEAADVLGRSYMTVRRMSEDGRLKRKRKPNDPQKRWLVDVPVEDGQVDHRALRTGGGDARQRQIVTTLAANNLALLELVASLQEQNKGLTDRLVALTDGALHGNTLREPSVTRVGRPAAVPRTRKRSR